MIDEYRTLYQPGKSEISIEKSRFIGYSAPISSEEEAIQFIDKIKAKHKDATHNTSAYVFGLQNEIQRYNDDGEPSGTAGIPILEVIKKENLRNIVIVVTRFFGGIKLGAGGLIRAYTKGAKIAVDAGQVISKRLHNIIQVDIDYTLLGKVQNEILQNNYLTKEIKYDQSVHLFIYVPINKQGIFKKQLTEWTNAKCEITKGGTDYLTVK
ncbi:MAG: hypothetical protein VR72_08045 [Clostridiaceae bacterium BRH_c20a]|nr:MAG: hypothetical protein VR72_08045 [Clostridiaceae bacterium BRH_c20a]